MQVLWLYYFTIIWFSICLAIKNVQHSDGISLSCVTAVSSPPQGFSRPPVASSPSVWSVHNTHHHIIRQKHKNICRMLTLSTNCVLKNNLHFENGLLSLVKILLHYFCQIFSPTKIVLNYPYENISMLRFRFQFLNFDLS